MKRVQRDYETDGLTIVWIGFQDRLSNIRRFMLKHNVQKGVGFDAGNVVAKRYGIRYGAGLVMIDGAGIVKERIPKGFSEKGLLRTVTAVLRPEKSGKG